MVLRHRVGDGLQQHRLTGARWSYDQTALSLAKRSDEIDNARGEVLRRSLRLQLRFRIQRREIVEENFLARLIGRFKVNGFNLDQSKISFTFFGRANLPAHGVAGAQVKLANLRR